MSPPSFCHNLDILALTFLTILKVFIVSLIHIKRFFFSYLSLYFLFNLLELGPVEGFAGRQYKEGEKRNIKRMTGSVCVFRSAETLA